MFLAKISVSDHTVSVTGDYTCHHQWAAHSVRTVEVWLLTGKYQLTQLPSIYLLFLMFCIALQLLKKIILPVKPPLSVIPVSSVLSGSTSPASVRG